jgi:hypothetical protein
MFAHGAQLSHLCGPATNRRMIKPLTTIGHQRGTYFDHDALGILYCFAHQALLEYKYFLVVNCLIINF